MRYLFLFAVIFCSMVSFSTGIAQTVSDHDVVWNTPSNNSAEAMPLGNGDVGINLWAEKTGDIYLYIGKNDSWGEYCNLLKVGKVKIHIEPNPFKEKYNLVQRLDLKNGQVLFTIRGKNRQINIKAWVDANNPVINLQFDSADDYFIDITPVVWRDQLRPISGNERHSVYGFIGSTDSIYIYPDTMITSEKDKIICLHQNKFSVWKPTLEKLGMAKWADTHPDPLMNNCFGYMIFGDKLKTDGSKIVFQNQSTKRKYFKILVHTENFKNQADYVKKINDLKKSYEKTPYEKHFSDHCKYWNNYWERSYIFLNGGSDAQLVGKSYILTKFLSECGSRGKFPDKFNGSIFTADSVEADKPFNVDYRQWGGLYWSQNTRLLYWPLLASGSFKNILPFFDMYLNALPFSEAQTKVLYNHKGAFFPETMYFWGSYGLDNFGWDNDYKNFKYTKNNYIRYYFDGALEVISMMIEYYNYTQDEVFIKKTILPFADKILTFYFEHYKSDDKGKLLIYPSQALETYWDVKNPTNIVAGLRWVMDHLLTIPEKSIGKEFAARLIKYKSKLPEIPMGEKDGNKIILCGEEIKAKPTNAENPDLYTVFPYKFFGVGKENLQTAINTYNNCAVRKAECWQQFDVVSALLGLTDSAKMYLTERCKKKNPKSRFPAMWGISYDYVPDMDGAGNLLLALQSMLMQCNGKEILLLPAWPKEWDVTFKLYAPFKTVVSGSFKNGKLENLEVYPKERKKEIKILLK